MTMKRRWSLLLLAVVPATVSLLVNAAVTPALAGSRFTTPIALPQSSGFGEPSITADPTGILFATAPQKLGNVTGTGSPVWVSTNGGRSFGSPVNPNGDPVSGGDTDIVTDAAGNVYQTDLWLGNSAMAVSTDHGQSFVANEWGHVQPGDDRPWLAYSPSDQNLYLTWDGLDGIHVGRTNVGPPAGPDAGLGFPQDVIAVPECILGGNNPCSNPPIRQCVCPPGGIAVDPATGEVFLAYSEQNNRTLGGVGIASSTDQGLTWGYSSVPGTGSTGSAFDTEWNFDPIKVDSSGHVYVAWGEQDPSTGSVSIRFATSSDHGLTWSKPVVVSTTTGTNVFPTMDVVSPGVVDISYYGTTATGDPNKVGRVTWNLYFAQVTNALTAPAFSPVVAVPAIHVGCIQAGGGASCSDRSLLDFFQLVVFNGKADIVYTAGDQFHGTQLYVVRQTA